MNTKLEKFYHVIVDILKFYHQTLISDFCGKNWPFSLEVKGIASRPGGLGFDARAGQIWCSVSPLLLRLFGAVLPMR